jgi:hypothetical protein
VSWNMGSTTKVDSGVLLGLREENLCPLFKARWRAEQAAPRKLPFGEQQGQLAGPEP